MFAVSMSLLPASSRLSGQVRLGAQPTCSPESLVGDFDIGDDFSTGIAAVDGFIGVIEFQ